jgi:hypothetical protein
MLSGYVCSVQFLKFELVKILQGWKSKKTPGFERSLKTCVPANVELVTGSGSLQIENYVNCVCGVIKHRTAARKYLEYLV